MLCRLLRTHGTHCLCRERRDPFGTGVRGGTRCVQLHLCRSDPEPGAAGLAGQPCAGVRVLWGCPEIVVPDNLKSGVKRACRYDPDLNASYQQWAEHYQVAVVPARPYKPKDKAKAEVGVQIVGALDPGPSAPPHVLLIGRTEPVHPCLAR